MLETFLFNMQNFNLFLLQSKSKITNNVSKTKN